MAQRCHGAVERGRRRSGRRLINNRSTDWGNGKITSHEGRDFGEMIIEERLTSSTIKIHCDYDAITDITCFDIGLTALDVSKNSRLNTLGCGSNKLTKLDLSQNLLIETVECLNNEFVEVKVNPQSKLTSLGVGNSKLTAEALNALFKQLPDVRNVPENGLAKKLWIKDNPGATTADKKIAIDKGWIVDLQ